MKNKYFRAAVALTAVLSTCISPTAAYAKPGFEYQVPRLGLKVVGTPGVETPPVDPPPPDPNPPDTTPQPQPGLSLSTRAINFGNIATHTTEKRQVLVSNPGNGLLTFSSAPQVSGSPEFSAGLTSCETSLAAGADCLAEVLFAPASIGSYEGVLSVHSNMANTPHEVTLLGTAFNPVSLSSSMLPAGMVGKPYTYDFKGLLNVSNEVNPDKSLATWEGSGALPAGLSLNTATGVLAGTPTTVTPSTDYRVTATYKNNQGQLVYTIQVGDATLEVLQISAGLIHTCAVTLTGGVKCWGSNSYGQLGDGTTVQKTKAVAVLGLASGVAAVSVGGTHSCALTNAGGLWCWGANSYGELGDNSTVQRSTLVAPVNLSSGVRSVSAGYSHTCAVLNTGSARCWGYNGQGQLGDGYTAQRLTPFPVTGMNSGVTSIHAGATGTCALLDTGAVKCWGSGYGLAPTAIASLSSGVSQLAASSASDNRCVILSSGALQCWGSNTHGQIGDGSTTNRSSPVLVFGMESGVASVAVGGKHTCAVTTAGGVKCWGQNTSGQLGRTSPASISTPTTVPGLESGVSALTLGNSHTCALITAGGMKCWGQNANGQLGDGSTTQRYAPVNVLP